MMCDGAGGGIISKVSLVRVLPWECLYIVYVYICIHKYI
jgi:hypothetical protein